MTGYRSSYLTRESPEPCEHCGLTIAALESESAQYREAAEKAEKECERLRAFIGGLAEGDCYYGDGCPMGARHGKCTWCQARTALAVGEPK